MREADGQYGQALGELVRMASALGDVDRLLRLASETDWDWVGAHDRRSEVLVAARRAGASRAQIAQRLRTMGGQRDALLDAIDALLAGEARDALVARERAFPEPPRPYTHVVGRVLPSRLVLAAEPDGAVRFFAQRTISQSPWSCPTAWRRSNNGRKHSSTARRVSSGSPAS